jgi:hypothetical protein
MNGEIALKYTFGLVLIVLLLAGCGGAAASDVAVCDAYQQLVDVWPSNSEEVDAAGSRDEIWGAITDAGEALVTASEAADTAELGRAGQRVGEAAAGFVDRNASIVEQGFVPFFTEDLVAGSELSQLCEEIGEPITLP